MLLNQPSSGHMRSSAPALAQRQHHIPLYNAAIANDTTCNQHHASALMKKQMQTSAVRLRLNIICWMQFQLHTVTAVTYSDDAARVVGLLQLPHRSIVLSAASFGPVYAHWILPLDSIQRKFLIAFQPPSAPPSPTHALQLSAPRAHERQPCTVYLSQAHPFGPFKLLGLFPAIKTKNRYCIHCVGLRKNG